MKRIAITTILLVFLVLLQGQDKGFGTVSQLAFYPGPFVQQGDVNNLRVIVDAEVDVLGYCTNFNTPGVDAYSQGGCPYGIWADAWGEGSIGNSYVRAGTSVGWYDSDGRYNESTGVGSQDCQMQYSGDPRQDFYCQ